MAPSISKSAKKLKLNLHPYIKEVLKFHHVCSLEAISHLNSEENVVKLFRQEVFFAVNRKSFKSYISCNTSEEAQQILKRMNNFLLGDVLALMSLANAAKREMNSNNTAVRAQTVKLEVSAEQLDTLNQGLSTTLVNTIAKQGVLLPEVRQQLQQPIFTIVTTVAIENNKVVGKFLCPFCLDYKKVGYQGKIPPTNGKGWTATNFITHVNGHNGMNAHVIEIQNN